MKYYFLNINLNSKSQVDLWIAEKNIAPIFYGKSTIDSIRKNNKEIHNLHPQAYRDAKLFVDTFDKSINEESIIISIGEKDVYLYKPISEVIEGFEINELEYKNENIKYIRIEILKKIKIKECPLVLVSIKSNRYISSGTFRDLNNEKYYGNLSAIKYCISRSNQTIINFDRKLQCLSSLEFETLIAKILEEIGFFVPAYKGGFIKNFDLFCKNLSKKDLIFHSKTIKENDSLSVQIKLKIERKHFDNKSDFYFCIWSTIKDPIVLTSNEIERILNKLPDSTIWLKNTLYWINWL
ncbi:hypothetical protein LEP1GSC195_0914 [Leptospira wolbachii serovar Codice str. CDC]|uniref:Uncharacterized protein n=1 Tax=Leptospira wolbachii serovar Codice str. CDC TaxID=1218599 RepID=R9A6V5_9LEPT|nr:hypothetical protein [Leptospira wolbachii]EOQ97827.1 hypothetical protein LEP1GSC195_0914 [Leptospira wolbachii serovar Codice str. CDC]